MTSYEKDGGPAFPFIHQTILDGEFVNEDIIKGMSLRAYFAAHAPVTWDMVPFPLGESHDDTSKFAGMAKLRVEFADAMLEALNPAPDILAALKETQAFVDDAAARMGIGDPK